MGDFSTALAEEPIHEGGITVVDVRNHCHVASLVGSSALFSAAVPGPRRRREAAEERLRGEEVATRER